MPVWRIVYYMEDMGNTLSIILSVIGALGGFEAIKWAVSTWINRKTNARKEDAAADSMEIDNEKKQIAWLENRMAQRDAKIDALYIELRQVQNEKLELISKLHEKELELETIKVKRCDVRGCTNRQPPSDY